MAFTNKKEHWLEVIFRDKVELPGDEGVIVPSGTTAERPASPDNGIIRYNTTDSRLEAYENNTWGPMGQEAGSTIEYFTDLLDTYASHAGRGNQLIRVNAGETALESVDGDTLWLSLANGGTVSSDIDMSGGSTITGLPVTPTSSSHAASKAYVDSISAGLDPKESCRAATTSDLPSYSSSGGSSGNGSFSSVNLTGPLTDGVSMSVSDRLLVKDQTDARQNGIYTVLTTGPGGSLERSSDMDSSPSNEVSGGNYTFVETGSQSGTGWVVVFDGNIIINTHNIDWSQFSGAGSASLAGLTDTVISAPANGEYLQYNGADWINVSNIPRLENSGGTVFVDTNAVSGQLDLEAADATGNGGAILLTAGSSTSTGAGGAITVLTGAGQNGSSGVLTLRGASAITSGIGGDVTMVAGNAAGDNRGGAVSITAGDTSGSNADGGTLSITSGTSNASGNGGDINITCGSGATGVYAGGSILLSPGDGPYAGTVSILPSSGSSSTELRFYEGSFNGSSFLGIKSPDAVSISTTWILPDGDGSASEFLQTDGAGNLQWGSVVVSTPDTIQDSDGDTFISTDFLTGDSDNLRVETGSTNPNGNGGLMEVITGDGGSASGLGGDLTVTLGTGGPAGRGGDFTFATGAGTTSGRGGDISITAANGGDGGATDPGGSGGKVDIIAGNAGNSTFGNAGNATLVRLIGGDGGSASAGPGNGGNASNVEITAGVGGSSNAAVAGSGGSVTIKAQHSVGDGTPGNLRMYSGDGGTSGGYAGEILLQAGSSSVFSGSNAGGNVGIYAGGSNSNADGANVNIYAGDGSSLATTNQNGGNVTLKAGDGTATNGDGGQVIIDVGAPQGSGDRGALVVTDDGLSTNGGEVRMLEGNGAGKHVGIKAPLAVPSSIVWELPNADGNTSQIVQTDGAGVLSFTDQVYDIDGRIIGSPITIGDVWRFSVPRAFTLNANALSTSFCSLASTATASTTFEIHLLAVGQTLIPGTGSATAIGSIVFGIASQTGVTTTWAKGAGPAVNAPVSIPVSNEVVLHYPIVDATLGDVSFTLEGNL